MSHIALEDDIERLNAFDSRRIKRLDLFKLKFIHHIEGSYQTGYNGEDSEEYYEKREEIVQVVCPGGWGAINDVAKYLKDSFFFPYIMDCTATELVGIEKVESDILMVDVEKLKELRNWNEDNAAKLKPTERDIVNAHKDSMSKLAETMKAFKAEKELRLKA